MEVSATNNTTSLTSTIESLVQKMTAAVEAKRADISNVHPTQTLSAVNLIQYLALRSEDIRSLQDQLHIFGLSSLTSSESHILRQAQAILERLGIPVPPEQQSPCD